MRRQNDSSVTKSSVSSRVPAEQSHVNWSVIDCAVKLTMCSGWLTWLLIVWHVISRCCAQSFQCPWPSLWTHVCVCVCDRDPLAPIITNELTCWIKDQALLSESTLGKELCSFMLCKLANVPQTSLCVCVRGGGSTGMTHSGRENTPARTHSHTPRRSKEAWGTSTQRSILITQWHTEDGETQTCFSCKLYDQTLL